MKSKLLWSFLASATLLSATEARTVVIPTLPLGLSVKVQVGPSAAPLPRLEKYPTARRHGYVWIPGHWDWQRHGYVWVEGFWARPPRHGAVYVVGHRERHHNHYVWVAGHWR